MLPPSVRLGLAAAFVLSCAPATRPPITVGPSRLPLLEPTVVAFPSGILDRPQSGTRSALHIVVRAVLAPGQGVESVDVRVRGSGVSDTATLSLPPALYTDAAGRVDRDSLPPGRFIIVARRIGYGSLATAVEVRPHCTTWVEMYLTQQVCNIGPCPGAAPPRVVVTTCEPAA